MLSDKSDQPLLKLVDFGLAHSVPDDIGGITESAGTPGYLSPESLTRTPNYGKPADVWALGVVTYILLCGYPPFYADNDRQLFRDIINVKYEFEEADWKNISSDAVEFIRSIFVKDPNKRPSVRELLAHPWMTGVHAPQNTSDHPDLSNAKSRMSSTQARKKMREAIESVMFISRVHDMQSHLVKHKVHEDADAGKTGVEPVMPV
jgi:serine/threonine protein kinase